MTQIEVPSWVVEAARRAHSVDRASNGELIDSLAGKDYGDRLIVGIITAALGAWVVQVGYQETITVQDDGVFADIEQKLWHWIPGKPIPESTADTFREPLYTLRQEKPE